MEECYKKLLEGEAGATDAPARDPVRQDLLNLCLDCLNIVINPDLAAKFGYQEEVACRCHDICVQEVRYICVKKITHKIPLPGKDGVAPGCRGGRVITGGFPATCLGVRVTCAQECLKPTCLGVDKEIGLEIALELQTTPPIILVINTTVTFQCDEFFRFPDGVSVKGPDLRDALRFIDGSCMVIEILRCEVLNETEPRVEVDLKVINKLWKFENLLVQAVRPYRDHNITVKEEFNNLHKIGPCPGGPCSP